MLCLNTSVNCNGDRCLVGFYDCSNRLELEINEEKSFVSFVGPIIDLVDANVTTKHYVYRFLFGVMIFIGINSNIASLSTFLRIRIRSTVPGVCLISYSVFGLLLMLCLFLLILITVHPNNYLIQIWTCRGFPFFSSLMISTGTMISAMLAIENLLNVSFHFDKFRSSRYAILIIFLCFLLSTLVNFNELLTRQIQTDKLQHFYCIYQTDHRRYFFQRNISNLRIFIVTSCIIHWICFVCFFTAKSSEKCLRRLFIDRQYFIPCLVITICVLLYGIYHNQTSWDSSFLHSTGHFQLVSLFILCAPHIFIYWIYILPNGFYLREFHQTWFYRIFCCYFYHRQRQIREFDIIEKLWQRRTSLETTMTISTLDDHCIPSELYACQIKMQV